MKKLKNTQAEMAYKPSIAQTICDSDRRTPEQIFKDIVGHAPPIEHQGCNQLIVTMNKAVSEGRASLTHQQTNHFFHPRTSHHD